MAAELITDANFKDVSDTEFLVAFDSSGDWMIGGSLLPGGFTRDMIYTIPGTGLGVIN